MIWRTYIIVGLALLAGCGPAGRGEVPTSPEAERYLLRGTQALERYAFAAALAYADSAASYPANEADAHFLKGLVYHAMGRFEASNAAYERVRTLRPEYPGLWNNIGNNAFRLQRHREAIAAYRREQRAGPAPVPWHGIGLAYQELGLVDSARHAFERAIALAEGYARAHLDLAQLLDREGEYESAFEHARRAAELAPGDLDARYFAGTLLVKLGRGEEARPYLEAVVEARPWHAGAHYNLGQVLAAAGEAGPAEEYLERAEALRELQQEVVQGEWDVRASPENAYAHAALAFALRRVGRYDEALRSYMTAYALASEELDIQVNIAGLHLLREDVPAAIDWYEAVLAVDEGRGDAWMNLGIARAISGDTAAARRAWDAVLALDPGNAQARAYLARLQAAP